MNSSFDGWDSSSNKDALRQCDVSASWTLCLQLSQAGLFVYSFFLIKLAQA
ncbi:11632_t:CDS:1, partial [Funneliformis geosporum]